jgi:GWxTD domain-containing protein
VAVQHINAELRESGAFTVSSVEFLLRPGKYRLDVTVDDSVGGRRVAKTTDLVGYPTRPPASDLVLSTRMRPFNADSSIGETEWRSGQILVTFDRPCAVETPRLPTAIGFSTLLEAYTADSDSGSMQVSIKDTTGRSVVQTAPIPVHLAAGGGVLRGQLNLEGLPSGEYQFDVRVQLASGTTDRSMPFTVLDLQAELERTGPTGPGPAYHRRRLLRRDERGRAGPGRGAAGVPGVIRGAPGVPRGHDRRQAAVLANSGSSATRTPPISGTRSAKSFTARIAYADSVYRERGSGTTSGWKTDRGRIYAKYGSPDELQDRVREGRAPPYQIWRYTRRRDTWLRLRRTGRAWAATSWCRPTTGPKVGLPGWKEIMTLDAVREIGLYLGGRLLRDRMRVTEPFTLPGHSWLLISQTVTVPFSRFR